MSTAKMEATKRICLKNQDVQCCDNTVCFLVLMRYDLSRPSGTCNTELVMYLFLSDNLPTAFTLVSNKCI